MAYVERALRINLDTGTTQTFDLPAALRERFLGGRGLTSALFYYLVPPDTPARSPENPLLIAPGVLAGTPSYATGGFVATTRSPLTGLLAHSWAVGDWGAALKRAGYDLLWIAGRSEHWRYLVIDNDRVTLEDAEHLLGLDTFETTNWLIADHGNDARVITLGTAGEHALPYASMVADGRYMAEPAGAGGVLGAKRLKALVVHGTRAVKPLQPQAFLAGFQVITQRVATDPLANTIRTYGSSAYTDLAHQAGGLTPHNGQYPDSLRMLAYSAETVAAYKPQEAHGCPRCPLPCYSDYVLNRVQRVARPEVEAIAGFGVRCGLESMETIIEANQRCLRYGLDPNATANAIAFLMECYQHSLTRQYPLQWGDDQAVLDAIDAIATKTGVGGLLALGVAEMSSIFYHSEDFAPMANGLSMTPLDPRVAQGWALHLATSPIGGDARAAMPWYEWLSTPPAWLAGPDAHHDPLLVDGKAERLIWHERFVAALDAAGLCRRLAVLAYQVTPQELATIVGADLGRDIKSAHLARIGESIITIERLLALQWGADDALPPRWANQALAGPRNAGRLPELATLLTRYYAQHKWDADGVPTPERLRELGISLPESRVWPSTQDT